MLPHVFRTMLAGFVFVAGIVGWTRTFAQPLLDAELGKARDRLLLTYSNFKGYGLPNPSDVYNQKLSPDRQALFDAIIRALFVELEDANGQATGNRVISLIEEVRGIWGVRAGETEGRRMFRLSVRFRNGTRRALSASSNVPNSFSGHVLLPVAKGGDDSPSFNGFEVKGGADVVTFRQAGPRPTLQLSMLSNDERIGEIDLDFDAGCGPWPIKRCHCRPANSDVGSRGGSTSDDHVVMLNARAPFFSLPLAPKWSNTTAHCKENY